MRSALPVLLAVVVLAALAPPASASIVLGEHIAGVRLGDPLSAVTARHGAPSRKLVGDEEGDYGLFWDRIRLHALMLTADDTVGLVSTTSTTQRTSRHIGPGVRASTARRRLTGERCATYYDGDRRREVLGCDVRSRTGATTTFVIWSGRVREVVLSRTG
jgi:hypothetical protein